MRFFGKYFLYLVIWGSVVILTSIWKFAPLKKNGELDNAQNSRPTIILNVLEGFEATTAARSPSGVLDVIAISVTPLPSLTPTLTPKPTRTPTPTIKPVSANELEEMFTKYSQNNSIDRDLLKRIAICESGLNINARNGIYAGLYQFSENTWVSIRRAINADNNLNLRFNPEEAIRTAAFKLSTNGSSAWPNCSK